MSEVYRPSSDEVLAAFLGGAAARFGFERRRFRKLPVPPGEVSCREYDAETERLERFLRGQRVLAEMERAA